ncbi:MAG: RCC1 domain-containing protein [Polyangiales bacterium]
MTRSALFFAFFVGGCGARTPLPEPGTRTADDAVIPPNEVRSVSVGGRHACAVKGDGSTYCWGAGEVGQLGDGHKANSASPVRVTGLEKVLEVAAGGRHSCARLTDGTVKCWGSRAVGQTGDGGSLLEGGNVLTTPATAVGVSGATSVVAGDAHTCVITGGAVQCFGSNDFGQLGNDGEERSPAAVRVHGASGATAISLGSSHSCMRGEDGSISCWGSNENGQLAGLAPEMCGSFACARHAQPVTPLGSAKSVSAGGNQTCATLDDGSVECWGLRVEGESFAPKVAPSLHDIVELSIGRSHLCGRTSTGSVLCLGDDTHGQLGFASTTSCPHGVGACTVDAAAVVGLPKPARAIAAGGDSTCAILVDGTLWCWGRNDVGQLGDGTTTDSTAPKKLIF